MINLDIKYLRAANIFCFGQDGIEIDFTKLPKMIHITGENLDVQDDEEERLASNGIGKSSIPEIIVYGLYGKTIKSPKKLSHDDLINKKVGKKLYVEIIWGKWRVVRTRKPNALRLWESETGTWDKDTEITLGGMPATQELIEKKIGLNFDTFVNLFVFTDNNSGNFLECDGPTKREIVENLMVLQEFREDFDNSKNDKNGIKSNISICNKVYEQLLIQFDGLKRRIIEIDDQEKKWKDQKHKEYLNLLAQIESKRSELGKTDNGAALSRYTDAQELILIHKDRIPGLEEKRVKIRTILEEARGKLETVREQRHQLQLQIRTIETDLQNAEADVKKNKKVLEIKTKKGTICPTCYGKIDEQNYQTVVMKAKNEIQHYEEIIKVKKPLLEINQTKITAITFSIKRLEDTVLLGEDKDKAFANDIDKSRFEINRLSAIQQPVLGMQEKLLQSQIEQLLEQSVGKQKEMSGPSPYVAILESTKKEIEAKADECDNKKKELEQLTLELPYYEYWVDGFSPVGIPRYIISQKIPALNDSIAYWMQFLIDGKIKLTFDDELQETIQRNPPDGDPFVYYVMSGGEKRRINLAVSQGFAYVMSVSCDVTPSVVFLDEVTTNIDQLGVLGVYNMILELAKEKQVFITTHDQGLLEMLSGCHTIYLRKKDGFTKIVDKKN